MRTNNRLRYQRSAFEYSSPKQYSFLGLLSDHCWGPATYWRWLQVENAPMNTFGLSMENKSCCGSSKSPFAGNAFPYKHTASLEVGSPNCRVVASWPLHPQKCAGHVIPSWPQTDTPLLFYSSFSWWYEIWVLCFVESKIPNDTLWIRLFFFFFHFS